MAIANITVNTNSPQGQVLKTIQALLYQARNLAKQTAELMNQETDGSSYTQIESQFGLAVGNGVTVYNLLVGLTTSTGLEASNVTQFCSRLN